MKEGLGQSIRVVKGVGPHLAQLLSKKGISTLEDALYFLPRAYEDRRRITPIRDLADGVYATVCAKVVTARAMGHGKRMRFEATVGDETGCLRLNWFHAYPSLKNDFAEGETFVLYGMVKLFQGRPEMPHPEYEKVKGDVPAKTFSFGRVVPVYSETEGLHQKVLRKVVGEALRQSLPLLEEPLPRALRERLGLWDLKQSFIGLHFPQTIPEEGELLPASRRVIFEEFFILQLGLGLKKQNRKKRTAPVLSGSPDEFVARLPFQLTGDQRRAIGAILGDLAKPTAMTRLVQGDVGCGKTVVALTAAFVAAKCGYQTAIMAPTEILALQHFNLARRLGLDSQLLVSGSERNVKASVVVGTHALFQEGVTFQKLALVVVDEQHRFGVDQRGELLAKGTKEGVHLLMMTATPIPRTLALTLYGDLDLTLIREKPADRPKIPTQVVRERDRHKVYQKIRETLGRGEQAYIIYPLVENSEKLELKSATEMHARLSREVFPGVPIGLLHGRLKSEEKDQLLAEFREGKWKLLVSTTVIEVGIDVANATLMVIEHAERLGLSQLHQLRGRVGRGTKPSECLLLSDTNSPRLRVMEQTEDGFEIAEEDLKIRGPGEFLGTRQSGLPGFRVGHIVRDAELLQTAREEAEALLARDPNLDDPENAAVRAMVESRWREKLERLRGG